MAEKSCCIVGAADTGNIAILHGPDDLVIAADAGYTALCRQGIKSDLVVGDFDSLGEAPENEAVIRYPVMKDDTDTMLAVKYGLARGFRRFCIYGGLGGRLDHTLANVQTLAYIAAQGGRGYLIGETENVTVVQNGSVSFSAVAQGTFSVFAQGGEATGVNISGALYPLIEATLTADFPLGVSNRFTGQPVTVSVARGMLAVIWNAPFACLRDADAQTIE